MHGDRHVFIPEKLTMCGQSTSALNKEQFSLTCEEVYGHLSNVYHLKKLQRLRNRGYKVCDLNEITFCLARLFTLDNLRPMVVEEHAQKCVDQGYLIWGCCLYTCFQTQ